MNRTVHVHLRSIMPDDPKPDEPVFHGGSSRPSVRFQELCELAGIQPKTDAETGEKTNWLLKDLRKTCATYYDQHVPESAIEILGHSVGGITYRHYAHRDPLAFRAITTPNPVHSGRSKKVSTMPALAADVNLPSRLEVAEFSGI